MAKLVIRQSDYDVDGGVEEKIAYTAARAYMAYSEIETYQIALDGLSPGPYRDRLMNRWTFWAESARFWGGRAVALRCALALAP
jgi:hypothetical protein